METRANQEQIRRYTEHFDGYRDSSILRRALVGDTTFKREVEEFYDLKIQRGRFPDIQFDKKSPEKIGTIPKHLFGECGNTRDAPSDESLLEYSLVRDSLAAREMHSISCAYKTVAGAIVCAILGGVAGFLSPEMVEYFGSDNLNNLSESVRTYVEHLESVKFDVAGYAAILTTQLWGMFTVPRSSHMGKKWREENPLESNVCNEFNRLYYNNG